ncbi:MAG: glycosyltransferase family 2 protein [Nanoarchaeota archaeon]|nr:glycosyltransferase family 2 protein [Nanoarchaeota archaeon]
MRRSNREIEVSFIIVNYNGGEFLKKVIDSIKNQDFPKNKREILLVDNNSIDGSPNIFLNDKEVFLIKSENNLGFAGGNNLGIGKSSGKYLALVNNDVILNKDWTKIMVSKMNEDSRIGIAGNKIFLRDTKNIWHGGAKIFFPGFVKHMKLEVECSLKFVTFASVMIRKNAGIKFDENYFLYYEDTDYCREAIKRGLKVIYLPNAESNHFIKSGRASPSEEYYLNRNRVYYYAKELNGLMKVLFLFGDIILFFPIFTLYRIIRQPNRIKYFGKILRARIDSIKMLK